MRKVKMAQGFTLIELMLVVIILGVLAAMVMPRFAGRSDDARQAAARTDINANLAMAIDLFEMDVRRLPSTQEGIAVLRSNPGGIEGWKGPYLKKDPKDPWNNPYHYIRPGVYNPEGYDLFSAGPNGTEGDEDDVGNW